MNDILRVKEKADIVDIISSYLELNQAGKSFKGRCPFHNEKTPSFFVSPERQNFYCFGCGAKGDVISFIEQYESLDFVGALKLLADRVGVELTGVGEKKDDASRLYAVLESATMFFEKNFEGNETARTYLKKRGLEEKMISEWRIGYAKDDWRSLYDYLLTQNFTASEMRDAGLIRDIEGGRIIDLFRNRIMFPIRDVSGRVIAFSGRTLSTEKSVPKYVNSPETYVFKKSSVLFGLFEAKQHIRKTGYSILVEGQMDVLLLHEKGLRNTIASSGTAFTSDQARIIKRISPKLILLYDGDKAGQDASLRSADIALGVGIETKIARVPQGVDPADLAIKDHEMIKDILKKSDHAIFVAARIAMEEEPRPERRVSVITHTVLPLVLKLESESLREHFVQELARMIGVSHDALWRDLVTLQEKGNVKELQEQGRASPTEGYIPEGEPLEDVRLVKVLRQLKGIMSWLEPEEGPKKENVSYIQQNIERILSTVGEEEKNNFIERAHDEASAFESEKMYSNTTDKDLKISIDDLLQQLELEILRRAYIETSDPEQKFNIRKKIDNLQGK